MLVAAPLRSPLPLLPFAAPPPPPPPPASLRGVRVRSGKWQARIKINGKVKSLGTYIDRRTAGLAYDRAALRHQGTKAQLNFPSVSLRASLGEGARRGNSTGEHERHHRGDHQHDTDGNTTRTSPLALLRDQPAAVLRATTATITEGNRPPISDQEISLFEAQAAALNMPRRQAFRRRSTRRRRATRTTNTNPTANAVKAGLIPSATLAGRRRRGKPKWNGGYVLELFSGRSQSFGRVARKLGYKVISVDVDKLCKADIKQDILEVIFPLRLAALLRLPQFFCSFF